ncbi:phosphoribosylformylglycinamidine synthase subunit PurS [Luethyella okanaganae]|uniref:Phosphoribosylformylglycinamidine synthase subunit PurS n=1 Tax=Luethyella okanaganae TaxID=69372 RepID=A0ABW1VH54_9MICO
MPTIVVEVMPKAELLDPQGKAVASALARIGKDRFAGVRIGKRFEITVDGPIDDAVRADVEAIAAEILSNSVIEDVVGIHYRDAGDLADALAAAHTSGGYDAPAGETH